ncbi:MAG: bifunctional phosphoglucose/phosphomannose isomerase [bacterium]
MQSLNKADIARFDQQGMLGRILNFPDQLKEALATAQSTIFSLEKTRVQNICVAGMGGSAIGGDIVRSCYGGVLRVPLVVNRDYRLPNFIDKNSLVIVCSYSGNTEETLSALEDAQRRGAQIVCISSGGAISERAASKEYPVFSVPPGYPPRSALGYLLVPILVILHSCGLLATNPESDVLEASRVVEKYARELHPDVENNFAKRIARRLKDKVPLIYGAVAGFEPVAMRWKGQLCENSKVLAFCNVFPELNHNEVMGWGPLEEINQRFQVVFLHDRDDHDQVKKRMQITKEIIEKYSEEIIEVESRGESLLARIFSLVYLGDMVSLYLAIVNQVDPTSIENIDTLKKKLAAA